MKVLFVSAEVTPFAKVGGLADVVGALPISLHKLGVDVRIMMPKYERLEAAPKPELAVQSVAVAFGKSGEWVKVYRSTLPSSSVTVYFLENERYLSTGPIYDERGTAGPFHDLARFAFFSRASVAVLPKLGWSPQIIHHHDWHTGLIPAFLLHDKKRAQRTLLTLHNLAHQGTWNAPDLLSLTGLNQKHNPRLQARDPRGDFNLLQQGILGATKLNTVSPQYAREVRLPEFGLGLEQTLEQRAEDFTGILNGIDIERFNPETDRDLRVRYGRTTIRRKAENKLALHEQCGFAPDVTAPTFAFIGRLADQKGIDLVAENAKLFIAAGARLVILGSGLPEYEQRLKTLAAKNPKAIFCKIGFDAPLAQRMYAGADLMLMPSKFEPCGIVQMIGMRYGTPTVAHATGGLKDTITDVGQRPDRGLGFIFSQYRADAFWAAVERALTCFRSDNWKVLVDRCMTQDFSWDRSARSYLQLYEQMYTI